MHPSVTFLKGATGLAYSHFPTKMEKLLHKVLNYKKEIRKWIKDERKEARYHLSTIYEKNRKFFHSAYSLHNLSETFSALVPIIKTLTFTKKKVMNVLGKQMVTSSKFKDLRSLVFFTEKN